MYLYKKKNYYSYITGTVNFIKWINSRDIWWIKKNSFDEKMLKAFLWSLGKYYVDQKYKIVDKSIPNAVSAYFWHKNYTSWT